MWKSKKEGAVDSLAHRITVLGGGLLLLTLFAICAVMTVLLNERAHERNLAWLRAEVNGVEQAVNAYDTTAKLLVERFFKVYRDQFGKAFALNEETGKLSQLGISLVEEHGAADKFTDFTGGAAALFMKKGDAYVLINGSLKNESGERAMGTLIPVDHPANALIKEGKPYSARETWFGKPYIVKFEPIFDLQKQVVGALFIGFDLTEFDMSLDALVAAAKFFDTGGMYVVSEQGVDKRAVVMLPASMRGQPLPQSGTHGRHVVAAARQALDESAELSEFDALLGTRGDQRFAVAAQAESSGWWVVAEVSSDEALRAQWLTLLPFLALFAGAAVVMAASLYLMIRRWVAVPLEALTAALARLAQGDLRPRGGAEAGWRNDEIGRMMSGLDAMRLRFVNMMGAIRNSADCISVASRQIASGNLDLSQRTEQTASNLQEAASSMQQVYQNVQLSCESAERADVLAQDAANAAQRGSDSMTEVVSRMGAISGAARQISDITGVIDAIAFQTNLLALNAAVEAARAGDLGRGFSVVAGEVRVLAQRAAVAAKEIKALVGNSCQEIEHGSNTAQAAHLRMQEIAASVARTTAMMESITTSSREQSERLGAINHSVASLDQLTQQNAALVEESAAAAASLQDQAIRLVEAIGIFRFEGQEAGAGLPALSEALDGGAAVEPATAPHQRMATV